MTTQYTTILKLALPVQGELSGTWGDVVNDNITQMVEQAVAGKAVVNTWTGNSHTLTTADGTTSESRCAILELTDSGTALTGAGTVVCPTNTKLYIVDNNTAEIVTVKTSGGTGVAVPVGKTMLVYCDGTNVVEGVTHANSLSLGTSTVTADKILDEDNMASDSATAIATQQSIKAYVDSQVGTVDTLAEILANGNTTGANDIDVDSAQKVQFRDAAIYINSSVDGQLDIVADGEVQIDTALVDINGNLDVSGTTNISGSVSFTKNAIAGVAISTTSRSSNTVTVTTSAVHGLTSGDLVNVNGVADTSFNGYFTVSVSSTTVFTYNQTGADGSSTGGTSTEVVYNLNASGTALNWMNGPLNIAANSGIDGLEITQSGAGNGLHVTGTTGLVGNTTLTGNLDVSGTTVSAGKITADAGIDIDNINIDGTTIALSSGDLTLDVAGDIILDADGGDIHFYDGGIPHGNFLLSGADFTIGSSQNNGDLIFRGIDGGADVTALTLDMSEAGAATFNAGITATTGTFSGVVTATVGPSATGLKVAATGSGDAFSATPLAAGSGVVLASLNSTLADYEPLRIIGETVTLEFRNGVGTSTAGLTIASTGAATFSGNIIPTGGSATAGSIWKSGANLLISMDTGGLYVNNSPDTSTVFQITDAGNVGIGVVPTDFTSRKSLDIGLAGKIWAHTAATETGIGANFYYDGAYKRIAANAATRYIQDGNGHTFDVTASSTAGSAISWTTAMTIDDAANVGIGVSAPESIVHIKDIGNVSTTLQIESAASQYAPVINFDGIVGASADYLLGEINGSWDTNTNVVSAIRFESGADTTNKDDGLISFWTSSSGPTLTERMRIDASGNVGIGCTPGYKFEVRTNDTSVTPQQVIRQIGSGDAAIGFQIPSAANWYAGVDNSASDSFVIGRGLAVGTDVAMTLDASGNLLVGVTAVQSFSGVTAAQNFVTPTNGNWAAGFRNTTATTPWGVAIDYTGAAPNNTTSNFLYLSDSAALRCSVMSNGGVQNYQANDVNLSDRREKTNFSPAKSYLDAICAIPVQTFNYIDQNMEDDPSVTLGVVAQDVQTVAPELVMESNWGTEEDPKMRLSIYQTDLQYALMKCIQEQQATIEALTARIAALES